MLAASVPTKFPLPFASSAGAGYIRAIPTASQIGIQNGAASLTDGFPPLTFIPTTAGGTPPFGQDFNGLLLQITQWSQWQAAGNAVPFDAAFAAALSPAGYPKGAILPGTGTGNAWVSAVDNNSTNPDTASPPSPNWRALATVPQMQGGAPFYAAATGAANTYAGTPNPAIPAGSALQTGMTIEIFFGTPNTSTTVVLNWSSTGNVAVVKQNGNVPAIGDIAGWLPFVFDGTSWRCNGPVASDLVGNGWFPLPLNTTYFVNPATGNDANNGLTSGTPWATLNHAWKWLQQNINANGFIITLSCAFPNNPTSYATFTATGGIVGVFSPSQMVITGDVSAQHCQITTAVASQSAVLAVNGAFFTIQGFNLSATGTLATALNVGSGSQVVFGSMVFNSSSLFAIASSNPGSIATAIAGSTNTFNGNYVGAMRATVGGQINVSNSTVNTGAGTMSTSWLSVTDCGVFSATATTFSNNVTGSRFQLLTNGVLDTQGAQVGLNTNYIPGSSAGTQATGGQFA